MKKHKIGRPRMYHKPPKMIGVHIPAQIHVAAKRDAAGLGISLSEYIRRSLVAGMPCLRPPARKLNIEWEAKP